MTKHLSLPKESFQSDIEDILFRPNSLISFNFVTPPDSLIGIIYVLTRSKRAYKKLTIDELSMFRLKNEELYLKGTGVDPTPVLGTSRIFLNTTVEDLDGGNLTVSI